MPRIMLLELNYYRFRMEWFWFWFWQYRPSLCAAQLVYYQEITISGGAIYKAFQTLPFGRRFILRTDHNSCIWLMGFKNIEEQLAR